MPQVVTTHEYDEAGRMVRSVTVTESEFDEHERAWFLALAAWRASRCPNCSGNLAETTDPENEERYKATSIRCYQCTAQAVEAKRFYVPEVTAPGAILYATRLLTRRG
jgi:uncharacterized protein with PIN domain